MDDQHHNVTSSAKRTLYTKQNVQEYFCGFSRTLYSLEHCLFWVSTALIPISCYNESKQYYNCSCFCTNELESSELFKATRSQDLSLCLFCGRPEADGKSFHVILQSDAFAIQSLFSHGKK